MPANRKKRKLAVLIDAENVSGKCAQVLFRTIATLGEANVRRIYGDFSAAATRAGMMPSVAGD